MKDVPVKIKDAQNGKIYSYFNRESLLELAKEQKIICFNDIIPSSKKDLKEAKMDKFVLDMLALNL